MDDGECQEFISQKNVGFFVGANVALAAKRASKAFNDDATVVSILRVGATVAIIDDRDALLACQSVGFTDKRGTLARIIKVDDVFNHVTPPIVASVQG